MIKTKLSSTELETLNKEIITNLKDKVLKKDESFRLKEDTLEIELICSNTDRPKDILSTYKSYKDLMCRREKKAILSLYDKGLYKLLRPKYRVNLYNNIVPIRVKIVNKEDNRWEGIFIDIQRGHILFIRHNLLEQSSYTYEISKILLDDSIGLEVDEIYVNDIKKEYIIN